MESIIVLVLLTITGNIHAATWDYGTNGPSTWATNYATCGGSSQSPINIVTNNVKVNYTLGLFSRSIFDTPPTGMTLKNNGHALQMDVTSGGYTISNTSLLPFDAKVAQYHLHWGSAVDSEGSEHTLDGVQYYGELHIVHYNTKYADLSAAADKSDGLAVLGFFITTDYPQDNEMIDQILDVVSNVDNKDDTFTVTSQFSIETLLPPDLSMYYRYQGSLTTPACYESVTWTVFKDKIRISPAQATKLSAALYDSTDTSGSKIGGNFRPVQALNERDVTSPSPLIQSSSSEKIKSTFVVGLIASVLAGIL